METKLYCSKAAYSKYYAPSGFGQSYSTFQGEGNFKTIRTEKHKCCGIKIYKLYNMFGYTCTHATADMTATHPTAKQLTK
jgi:hypothetical protein